MFVAGSILSLIAPIGVQASDFNIEGMNTYVRKKSSSKKNKQFNSNSFNNELATQKVESSIIEPTSFEAGTFSNTTVLDQKVVGALGAIGGVSDVNTDASDTVQLSYVYQMNLNTTFTGDDNLYTRLKTGEWATGWKEKGNTYHIEAKDNSDILKVDKLWYTFPIGESFTATYGPLIENYYMLAATPSVYKPGALKAFKLGGHSSAFGASTSQGLGLKYEADNGFASSITVNSKGAASTNGFLTDQDESKVNTMLAYTTDQYHASVTYSKQTTGWDAWTYYSTDDVADHGEYSNADAYAFRVWWRPKETGTAMPSISLGYDTISFEDHALAETASGYMVGLNWQDVYQPSDRVGIAFGSVLAIDDHVADAADTDEVDPFLWEAYYSFRPNDSI